jgi:hypothetical protein
MPRHQLNPDNNVHGAFTLEKGRLTFKTGDPALTQRLESDRAAGRPSQVCLLAADPVEEFTGTLVSTKLVKVERPQQWEVVMSEQRPKPQKRG